MFQKLVDLLKPDVSTEAKLTGVTVTVGKDLDRIHETLGTLETKILIPLRDGIDGKDGKDGKNGKDSVGKNGVSVVDAEIAADAAGPVTTAWNITACTLHCGMQWKEIV